MWHQHSVLKQSAWLGRWRGGWETGIASRDMEQRFWAEGPQLIIRGNRIPPVWCQGKYSVQLRRGRILVCVKKQDAEIYRNYRNFLPLSSALSFLFSTFSSDLCLTFCLSLCNHLLAKLLQNTLILNVCSSTSLTIFSLSFSVSSLLVKLISIMMILLNMVKWFLSHQNQLFIALLSGTSHFHAFPCHFRCRNSNITFFYSPLPSSPLGREGHSLSYVFNLLLERAWDVKWTILFLSLIPFSWESQSPQANGLPSVEAASDIFLVLLTPRPLPRPHPHHFCAHCTDNSPSAEADGP